MNTNIRKFCPLDGTRLKPYQPLYVKCPTCNSKWFFEKDDFDNMWYLSQANNVVVNADGETV